MLQLPADRRKTMRSQTLSAGLLAVVRSACNANGIPFTADAVQYPAANLESDTYQPRADWKLVWSDEFQGDTINAKNWNFQV
ncbi:MAG: hypothetical protein WBM61_06005, partial [Woeseiaceae bacterium]